MSSDVISKTKPTDVRPNNLNRRNILLGSTVIAAASTIGSAPPRPSHKRNLDPRRPAGGSGRTSS